MRNDYTDYLMHHGILNQRWGQQNGPKYPLSAAQKAIGKVRSKIADLKDQGKAIPKSLTQKISKVEGKTPAQKKIVSKIKQEAKQEAGQPAKQGFEPIKVTQYKLAKASDVYAHRTELTDKQINDYLNRVRLEKQLAELAAEQYKQDHKVQTYFKDMGSRMLDNVKNNTANAVSNALNNAVQKSIQKALAPDKDDKEK